MKNRQQWSQELLEKQERIAWWEQHRSAEEYELLNDYQYEVRP